MTKPQKILTIALWILAVGGMVGVVAMRTQTQPPTNAVNPTTQPDGAVAQVMNDPVVAADTSLPILYPAASFVLTDENGKTATNSQLLGKPWVADFFFTTCATLCPMMSAHMEELQNRLPPDVRLVSFSVDPTHDTPAVLKTYAAQFHAQPGRWLFLTGDEKVQENVVRAMKIGFAPAEGSAPIQHDEHFLLVDAQGNVRGVYDSLVPERMNDLVRDANSLVATPAGHNASGAVQ
jgi:protein SCO1/2